MAGARKLTVRWNQAFSDDRMTSFHFGPDEVDQEATIEAAFDTLWTALKVKYHSAVRLSEYRWYFSSTVPSDWGDADRVIDRDVPGTAGGVQLPPQCAIVVTHVLTSGFKRHQGRNYFPAPSRDVLADGGYLDSSTCVLLADKLRDFLNAARAIEYMPFVKATATVGGSTVPAQYQYNSIRVNNVFDTQRRRALGTPTQTENRTLT